MNISKLGGAHKLTDLLDQSFLKVNSLKIMIETITTITILKVKNLNLNFMLKFRYTYIEFIRKQRK